MPTDPNRVVADLTLGFWVGLFDSPYEQRFVNHILGPTFPYIPRRFRARSHVLGMLEPIRRLRNRAFHHEPIWYRPDLSQRYEEILTVMSWINLALRDAHTMLIDHFPEILAHGYGPCEQRLKQLTLIRSGSP
jgi:hypothetical protein